MRQTFRKVYRPNGAVYAVDRGFLMKEHRMFGDRMTGIEMPKKRSFDIDTEEDFEILEAIVRNL